MRRLKICEATIENAAKIASLVNTAYRPKPGNGGWTHESDLVSGDRTGAEQIAGALANTKILIALQDSKIVACVQIEKKNSEAYIGMLAVEPSCQALGLGKMMLTEAERYAVSSLGARQFVLVVLRERTELVRFYIRRGYEETGQRHPYPIDSGVGKPRSENLELTLLRKCVHPSPQ